MIAAGPLGFLAIECGWFVTELGRQPWIIYGIMRTKDAVTPMTNLIIPFTTLTIVYLGLAVIVVHLLRREFLRTATGPTNDDAPTEQLSRGGNGQGKEDNIA